MQGYKRHRANNNFSGYQGYERKKKEYDTPKPQGLQVYLRDGEEINKALRKLKKKIERAGIIKEIRDRQYYQKPSEKKRMAKKAGIARVKKRKKELNYYR